MNTFTKLTASTFLIVIPSLVSNVLADTESPPRISAIAPNCALPGESVVISGHGLGAHNVTIEVDGEAAEIVKATGHSSEFLLPSTLTPGFTKVSAVNPGGQEGSIDLQVKGDEICGNGIDDDCDGEEDELDECPLAFIEVDTSPFDLKFSPGEKGNISTNVKYNSFSSEPATIAVSQKINAISGPESGITVSPAVVGGFVSSEDKATVDNQVITAKSEGVYEIITTAKITETGETASSIVQVTVKNNHQTLSVGIPGSDPGGIAPDSNTPVVFVVQIQGAKSDVPIDVVLNGDIEIELNDQGIDGDIASNDGSYSGTYIVDSTGLSSGDCLYATATAVQNGVKASSDPYPFCVTSLPVEIAVSDFSSTVSDPLSGDSVIADEILIVVLPDTDENTISEIAASVGGSIVGAIPEVNIYQIKLQAPVASMSEFESLIEKVELFEEILSATTNAIVKMDAVYPEDDLNESQSGIKKIRADESWTIARGKVTIAIVDSGADLDHPDLSSKIIKGKDYIDKDNEPEDKNGHGTHVAGIAAALTNNKEGISGISWGSKILIVRIFDSNKHGTSLTTTRGIIYSANKGSRIINISGGGYSGKYIKCLAVLYSNLKGSIIVASAGNDATDKKYYPAACPGAIAVGNTTLADARYHESNFGSWVDLAAPGLNVLSTVPKGKNCSGCNEAGYGYKTGTSMSAPMVSGSAAVLLSREPTLSNKEVEERLKRTAVKLPSSAKLGAGRIDLFEAVFNGSFEEGNLALWSREGTASSKKSLGQIVPQDRNRMGSVSTGPAGAQVSGSISQSFTIQPGVTSFPISFKYTFVTEEYPEFVGSIYDDSLKIVLVTPSGNSIILAEESVNASSFTAINGLDFPGGDNTLGWTGWKTVSKTIPVSEGPGTYQILLEDAGDSIFDTETLIDGIKFK